MLNRPKSQIKDVLKYLQECGSITSFEAFEQFHITRLSSIIHRLRKLGYNIVTIPVAGRNDYGYYEYALYQLRDPEDD